MSITRAQQAKQMLQNGGRIGLRGGNKGPGQASRESRESRDNRDRGMGMGGKQRSAPARDTGGRDPMAQFSPEAAATAREMRNATMGVGDRFVPDFLPTTKAIANLFQISKPTPFDLQRRGFIQALGTKPVIGGGGGGDSQAMAGIPTWMQLGFSSEAEYLASLEQDEENEKDDTDKRALAFRADGGRIGLQEGGGIEQRLEQLGGDVTSAEQMLQGINKRLETAESSLGSGGGGLGSLPSNPMQTPPGMFPAGPPNFDTAFGGAFKGLDMSGFKPVMSPQQDMVNFSINGNEVQGMNSAFVGSLKKYLDSTGQGDAFSIPGFTPLGQAQAVQQARPGLLPNTRPMGIAAADGTMSLMPNPLSPQQQMEQANAAAEKLSPEERVQGAFGTLQNRAMKTPQERAYLNRVIKSEGMDYLFDLDYFTNSGLRAGGGGSLGIPAAGYADGGNVVGGEYDFESARQMYGLGKLVKKIGKTVKKIAKSPIGKAALLYAGGSYLTGANNFFGGLKGAGIFSKAKLFGTAGNIGYAMPGRGVFTPATKGILGKLGLTAGGGSLMPTALGGIAAASALAGLLTAKQEEEAQELSRGEGIDIEAARRSILARAQGDVAGDLRATAFLAEGGKPEPVAKKTMPLLDMDGKEMDLREEGGFVPIGRMEKADDVPARLSKNEFVFTADAVRNAGDGDVDKGAEVMYNMMKNLEAGGEVSEESQGLEGARKMFQTSQRLEEVL